MHTFCFAGKYIILFTIAQCDAEYTKNDFHEQFPTGRKNYHKHGSTFK